MNKNDRRYQEYHRKLSAYREVKSLAEKLKSMKDQEFICSIPVAEEKETELHAENK